MLKWNKVKFLCFGIYNQQKKALREQWLMEGLCQQSEEEKEAMRLQVLGEQQKSDQLQSNILRYIKAQFIAEHFTQLWEGQKMWRHVVGIYIWSRCASAKFEGNLQKQN